MTPRLPGSTPSCHRTTANRAAACEGAVLARVPAELLRDPVDAGDRPRLHVLADLAGEDPQSSVIQYNRMVWNRPR